MRGRTILHYRVVDKLAEGGMAEVYLAQDLVLGRKVALKFPAESALREPAARERFLREARSAAALDHPYICKIYEVAEVEGRDFIAMEYIEGETLRRRLRRGPLPPDEAGTIAEEIAEALDEACKQGIVHRDLKPSNIMLTRHGHIKVLDFGLAKQIRTALIDADRGSTESESITAKGAIVGTLAYMSPEQLRGETVDTRSDIFSLGIILYEMLAGVHPFSKPTRIDTVNAILSEEPPPLARHQVGIPQTLQRLLDRMLAKGPAMRVSRPGEVIAGLRAADDESTRTEIQPKSDMRRRAALLLPVIGLLLALMVWKAPWGHFGGVGVAVPAGTYVLMGAVENRTGDPQLDAVRAVLENQLRQSSYVNLPEPSRIQESLQRMLRQSDQKLEPVTAREVAWREGIPVVVTGSVSQLGQIYILDLGLEKIGDTPTRPEESWSRTFRAENKELVLRAIDEGSHWIRRALGEASQDLAKLDLPARGTTTGSWEALHLFSRAERLKREDKDEDAVLLLQEAVKIDSQFALAHMRLGDLLFGLRRYHEGFEYYRKALEGIERGRLSKREELNIKALYAHDSGDHAGAARLFKTFSLHYPNDYYPLFFQGITLKESAREEEAVRKLVEAEQMNPQAYYMPAHLAMSYMILGRHDQAAEKIERLRSLGHREWADALEGISAFIQGKYPEAREKLSAVLRSSTVRWQSQGYALLAALYGEMGQYQEALRCLRDGILLDARTGQVVPQADKLLSGAYIHYVRKDRQSLRDNCLEAVRLESSPMRLRRAGTLLARAGYLTEAAGLVKHLDPDYDAPIYKIAKHAIRGEILLYRRELNEALLEFGAVDRLDPPHRDRMYLANARSLSGDVQGALRIYRDIVESRGRVWQYPDQNFPGFWAESLLRLIQLSWSSRKSEGLRLQIEEYLELRKHADADVAELSDVRRIVRELDSQQVAR